MENAMERNWATLSKVGGSWQSQSSSPRPRAGQPGSYSRQERGLESKNTTTTTPQRLPHFSFSPITVLSLKTWESNISLWHLYSCFIPPSLWLYLKIKIKLERIKDTCGYGKRDQLSGVAKVRSGRTPSALPIPSRKLWD